LRRSGKPMKYRFTLCVTVFLVLCSILSSACGGRIVRVPVSEEDLLRANEAAREGDVAFNRKDYYAALIKYLEASRFNPNSEYIFNRLGITYSQLTYYDQAAAAFERSIGLDPKYSYAVNNLGSVRFAQKNLKKAEKHFKKAIKLNKKEASFHMNLGALYFQKKKYDKAMKEWKTGMELDPDILSKSEAISLSISGGKESLMERSYFMARLYASKGNVVKAIENLQQALLDGFSDIEAIRSNPDFDPIRQDELFLKFMQDAPLMISGEKPPNPQPNRATG
jgi:tetratricopeptide (TPR) repeat protein